MARTESIWIYFDISKVDINWLENSGIDYEFSSAQDAHIAYIHMNKCFPIPEDMIQFFAAVYKVEHKLKGSDWLDVYHLVSEIPEDTKYYYILTNGDIYRNTKFSELATGKVQMQNILFEHKVIELINQIVL